MTPTIECPECGEDLAIAVGRPQLVHEVGTVRLSVGLSEEAKEHLRSHFADG